MPLFYLLSERQLSVLNRFMITDQFNKNVRKSLKSLNRIWEAVSTKQREEPFVILSRTYQNLS